MFISTNPSNSNRINLGQSDDPYDYSNYFEYNEDLGIYDFYDQSNPFLRDLKDLTFNTSLSVTNEILDLLSYKIYGTEKLWWVIGIYNDIVDPMEIDKEIVLAPSLSDLNQLFNTYFTNKKMKSVRG